MQNDSNKATASGRRLTDRILKNSGALLTGNAVSSLMGFLSFGIVAHLIRPTEFGNLVVISAYASLISRLLGFQSWQALVRFGSEVRDDPVQLSLVIGAGFLLDGGAALLGTLVFLVTVPIFAHWQALTLPTTLLALGFGTTIVTNLVGMPTGLLRLFDRFRLLAWQETISGGFRLLLLIPVYLLHGRTIAIGVAWIVSQVLAQLVLIYLGLREMRRHALPFPGLHRVFDFLRHHPSLYRFFLLSNLQATFRVLRDADVLIVGVVLTPTAAGLYRIARQLGALAAKPADAMYTAIYPELMALIHARRFDLLKHMMLRSSLYAAAFAMIALAIFALVGRDALKLFFGARYAPAYKISLVVLLSYLVWSVAHPLSPALLALDRQRHLFQIQLTTTVVYLALLYALGLAFGLAGTGFALVAFNALWLVLALMTVRKELQGRLEDKSEPPPDIREKT